MKDSRQNKRDWIDITLKVFTPIVAGLLIAWAGFVSNMALSSISSKKESARLITELQISREQAESELRKDVFDQTLQAFLLKNPDNDFSIRGMSKQLLRLELLTLNFGDSLSLSPLFTEFRRDLKLIKPIGDERITFDEDIGGLTRRLDSLAKRVASAQVSSLIQHGVSVEITVFLNGYINHTALHCDKKSHLNSTILTSEHYSWPERNVQTGFSIYDDENTLLTDSEKQLQTKDDVISSLFASDNHSELLSVYLEQFNGLRVMTLDNTVRYFEIDIKDVDVCRENAQITVYVYKDKNPGVLVDDTETEVQQQIAVAENTKVEFQQTALALQAHNIISGEGALKEAVYTGLELEVERSFKLNYFNFPIVDNTRLENNHRFAVVLDEFDLDSEQATIKLTAIIFPSEYASLRDRPGMKEARKLFDSALGDDNADSTINFWNW